MEDNNSFSNPMIPPRPRGGRTSPTLVSINVLLFVILGLIILGILNYFNILPLSKINPAIFGALPHKTAADNLTQNSASDSPSGLDSHARTMIPFIPCPVTPEICKNGREVTKEVDGKTVYGLSFEISKTSLVAASSPGEKSAIANNSFTISSGEKGIKLEYLFSNEFKDIDAGVVTEGQPLGSPVAGGTLTIYGTAMAVNDSIHLGIGEGGSFLTHK